MARDRERKSYELVCPLCGTADTVPFRPRPDTLCRKCHKNSRKHIPRKDHGTRVSFPITCSSCNKYEVLTYRPRVPLTEVLCSDCMRHKVDESSTWADIQDEEKRIVAREAMRALKDKYNRQEYEEEEEEIVDGSKDALAGAQSLGQSVYIRPKQSSAEDVEPKTPAAADAPVEPVASVAQESFEIEQDSFDVVQDAFDVVQESFDQEEE